MKEQDKNSLIGFFLMMIIIIIFNIFFFPNTEKESKENPILEIQQTNETNETNETKEKSEANTNDSISSLKYGIFSKNTNGDEKFYIIENDKIKVSVSNKGGRIASVILKEYQTYDSLPLELFNSDSSIFNLQFTTGHNINTSDLYFKHLEITDGLSMRLEIDKQHYIEYLYKINNDYLVDLDINIVGLEDIIPASINYLNLEWQMKTPQTEKSKSNQDMYTGIYYQVQADKEVDNLSLTANNDNEEINSTIKWVAFKQQFFSSILISKSGFQKPTILQSNKNDNSKFIKNLYAKFELEYNHQNIENNKLQFYFGPNHYKTLESYASSFEEIIPLGWGIFGWVNEYIIINLFDLLSRYISNYGLIILLLTIIIKMGLSPFTYKAFLSQAKMKVLKPEIDKLNDKLKGKDPMKMQQATMSLYRNAGVNPMGGCLPMLFQFPILIAMFRFFPASIELRQQKFLWADDLSAYDSILELGFNIPFYGDHVSLFTLLMTISTLLYTKMNSSMATGQMAQMKWMMYLMPIMFLGFFNNYAAGLSYYYFLANMITFSQQYLMKKFIDEKAILAQIEKNKKTPKKKSNFQKKLEDLQKKQEAKMRKRK